MLYRPLRLPSGAARANNSLPADILGAGNPEVVDFTVRDPNPP